MYMSECSLLNLVQSFVSLLIFFLKGELTPQCTFCTKMFPLLKATLDIYAIIQTDKPLPGWV